MTNKLYLQINGNDIDVLEGTDFEFRLNRFVQDIQNFQVKGGDTSYPLDIPFTKNNAKAFNVSYAVQAINKFNRTIPYHFSLGFNGIELLSGTATINEITPNSINIEFKGESIDWIQLLEETPLNRLGYVNNEPTWFGGNRLGSIFEGGDTMNLVNGLDNRQTDYICPTLVRFNTPITDYLTTPLGDIFGVTDNLGNEILAPKEFPDSFVTQRGYFGQRQGLTFEDFPPALYMRNLIEKCFDEIGYNVDSSLFNEDWFNRLYIPYQGDDFYKYNWKTLAELQVRFTGSRVISDIATSIPSDIEIDSLALPYLGTAAYYYRHRLGNSDDVPQRVDRVSNFNKFLVSDETNGYVVPAKGKYKIRVKTELFKRHSDAIGTTITAINNYDTFVGAGKSWSDTVFVILRKSPEGTTLLRENPLQDVLLWMTGQYPFFTQTPSDIIAFYSPYQATVYGSSQDPNASGSPLTNFQTMVDVTAGTYAASTTLISAETTSTADFNIEVDLLRNERVEFYAISLGLLTQITVPQMNLYEADINDVSSLIDIDYICSYDDISLADNLPDITAKDMVRNFINTFNLRWLVTGNTVRFVTEKEYFNNDFPYDITDRVDVTTVRYTPTNVPKNVRIGYENDLNDNELNIITSDCIEDVRNPSNYANKTFFDNPNIYAKDIQDFGNGFSATRFIEADFSDLADFDNLNLTIVNITIPFPIPFYSSFVKGRTFAPSQSNNLFRMPVPSLQSIDSVDERNVGDLTYSFDQPLRLLQHYGKAGRIFDTDLSVQKDLRFIINAPDNSVCTESKYWISPTYSSFDFEQPSYSAFASPNNVNVPTQSMRYDVTGGLYDLYFSDIIELTNKSYVLTCQAYLRSIDWNSLQPNRIIMYQDSLYRLLEITDYDVNGVEPCTIKMIKV